MYKNVKKALYLAPYKKKKEGKNMNKELYERLYENWDPYELRDNGINSLDDFIDAVKATDVNDVISYLLDLIEELETNI